MGDAVVAIRNGGYDRHGLPVQRPMAGKVYRVTGIYEMAYGLGCTLEGMDPRPYKGYFLLVRPGYGARSGWYFKKVERASDEFIDMLHRMRAKEDAR